MRENWGLTNSAVHGILVMPDQPTQDCVFLGKYRYLHLVNIAPCRSQTDESPANWSGNRWQSSYAGLSFLPPTSAKRHCDNSDAMLTTTTGGPVMAANRNTSTTPHESPNHPEHNSSTAPSHDDPAAALAALWPYLSPRDRRCLYALCIGFLMLSGQEVVS